MIAEIKGKVNSANTNLTERREDELTGNFFGNMRYISFAKGMKKILQNGIQPVELREVVEEIDTDYWDECLFFWEKVKEGGSYSELDVRMDFPTVTIGVEIKFRSGLSSEDADSEDKDSGDDDSGDGEGAESITAENSANQLSREARVLRTVGKDTKKLLLLLADETECAETVRRARTKIADGVRLGYLSWQEVLVQLKKLTDLNDYEQLIVTDVIELLEKKGFARFRDFMLDAPDIEGEGFWHFDRKDERIKFSFGYDMEVEDGYYEFG